MYYDKEKERGDSFTIVWYSVDLGADAGESFFYDVLEKFRGHGFEPTHISIKKNNVRSEVSPFSHYEGGLPDNWGAIDDVAIYSMPSGNKSFLKEYNYFFVVDKKEKSVLLTFAGLKYDARQRAWAKAVMEGGLSMCQYSYGIGITLPVGAMPSLWVAGRAGCGNPVMRAQWQEELHLKHKSWIDFIYPKSLWNKGVLRDIFDNNYLTSRTLDHPDHSGATLREWINSNSSGHGLLRQLAKDMWVWEVSSENIESTRQSMLDQKRMMHYIELAEMFSAHLM